MVQLTAAEITARLGPLGWIVDSGIDEARKADVWVTPPASGHQWWASVTRWADGAVEFHGDAAAILAAAEALGMCIVIPDAADLPPVPETVEQGMRMARTAAVVEAARNIFVLVDSRANPHSLARIYRGRPFEQAVKDLRYALWALDAAGEAGP